MRALISVSDKTGVVEFAKKLVDLGFKVPSVDENDVPIEGDVITITNGTGDKAKTVELKITKDTKVSDFVNSLKEAGLTASFDEKQGRFFIFHLGELSGLGE